MTQRSVAAIDEADHWAAQRTRAHQELLDTIAHFKTVERLIKRFPGLRASRDRWDTLKGYIAPTLKPEDCTEVEYHMYQGQRATPHAIIDGIKIYPQDVSPFQITGIYQDSFRNSDGELVEHNFYPPRLGWRDEMTAAGFGHLISQVEIFLNALADHENDTRAFYHNDDMMESDEDAEEDEV